MKHKKQLKNAYLLNTPLNSTFTWALGAMKEQIVRAPSERKHVRTWDAFIRETKAVSLQAMKSLMFSITLPTLLEGLPVLF
jgi:hypothetical protein